uniref:Rho GTPase activating protein 31 n=1 Tax=Sinocyclocheilus grahami TaxID=75366 RepID=A0A672LNQ4_SINGR
MKNKAAKLKSKRKGTENAFGCDLTDHLQTSGQDVPYVLKTCAEFIEKHGIVDGIYRLSGITSNIQKLRQEFCSESCPDLTKEVYLQDIHCVGSLCKLYFRELPNPLLTYELYKKFTDAMSVKEGQEQLRNIRSVIKELPVSHLRTLEYLTKHLAHLATLSHQTNMHSRNLALVWAPNLLRSKEVEVPSCNGDIAFLEVRVQQSIVEFILNHTEQIFNQDIQPSKSIEGTKYATLPASTQCGPMKLMSLEEAQARSLSPNHPAMRERQRENSLPDTSTATMYHTVIDLSDNRRKFSGKSKKWKSIFSLGRSVIDSKGKLSRNGSVFMRGQNPSEKPAIRPSKSMDSLCSFQAAGGAIDLHIYTPTEGSNGIFIPVLKSRTLGSDIDYNLNKKDQKWDLDPHTASGGSLNEKREGASNASSSSPSLSPLQKALPEQLKVFKGDDRSGCQPTSPKNRRMLYSGSASNGSRPSFPGSLFPMESSPRHQRKALNISEPFAVSVPLRVSAVINSNSTPCRAPGKERDRGLGGLFKPTKEAGPLEPHRSESIGTAGLRVPSSDNTSKSNLSDNSSIYAKSHVHTSLQSDTKEPFVSKDICEKVNKEVSDEPQKLDLAEIIKGSLERLSTCLNEHHHTLESFYQDDLDTWGSHLGGLDQVEPWEDLCSAKQWVTSPLHSPKLEDHLPTPRETMPCQAIHSQVLDNPKVDDFPNSKKAEAKEPAVLNDITSSQTEAAVTAACELGNSDFPKGNKNAGTDVACFAQITEHFDSDNLKWMGDKDGRKLEIPQVKILKTFTDADETTGLQNMSKAKQKRSSPSQRFHRQTSNESCIVERSHENIKPKLRPCSLNLDLGHQGIRDISNSQYLKSAQHSNAQEWLTPEAKHGSSSLELELFLSGSKAPVRRNSAPVSVSSIRTAFMIKTCKAKAVPVIPPKIQYSHIPHALPEGSTDQVNKSTSEKEPTKLGNAGSALPLQTVHREDVPSSEPPSAVQRQIPMSNATCNENYKPTSIPDLPVLRRKRSANGDTFMDRPRPERSSLLQRSSFRNRPRPQSLILFSPPFPIMDYPPVGDDGKLVLSPIKAEASPFDVCSNELAGNLKTTEGVTLRNKMTLPKSGQRLETSTSCFYQPQRRSMIFDNRSNRQIE